MLKSGTAESHDRIDRRMGALDLTSRDGLGRFLGAHYLVRQRLDPMLGEARPSSCMEALEADLAALGLGLPAWDVPPDPEPFHPVGYRYVMAGSQLGTRLLHKEWSAATDIHVKAAGRFFETGRTGRDWPALLSELAGMSPSDAERDAMLRGANQVFVVFGLAATRIGVPNIK